MATAANTVNKIQKFSYTSANNTTVYNSDLKVQGNIAITGAYNSDLTVVGNLTVLGSQTYAQTQTLLVKDNIITLNAAIDQSGTPLFNAGIEVDRGNQPNVAFIWNESSQAWQFTNNGTTYESLGGGSAGVYANGAFIQANAAFNAANNSSDPWVRNQANASFIQANAAFNAANNASDSWVRNQANSAFVQANAAYAFANSASAWGTRQAFKATAGQTIFTPGSGYLPGSVDVYYNGLKLYDGEDFTATDGVNVILANPATVNSTIDIVGFGANSVAANVYVLNSMTSIVQRQTFFANSGQTTFTVTGGYRIGYLDVFYNGLKINIPEDVTANNGTTIDFIGLTPTTNDIIEVVGLTPNVALANAIPITGGTISGGLNIAGNLIPTSDNTYYLGSATNRWHSLFVGPGSVDIGGLKLSNVGGVLSVASPGAPSTPIPGEDAWARIQANSAFSSANNVAPQLAPAFNTANAAFIKANSAITYDANTSNTGYFALPSGTTAQRPASGANGHIRYNTTLGRLETYLPSAGWTNIVSDNYTVEYLIIAGGGAGGGQDVAGGGGAGGLINGSVSVIPLTSYPVIVGAGGTGTTPARGANGTNSSALSQTAYGGGGGGAGNASGYSDVNRGYAGGSGGGGTWGLPGGPGTPGQGYAGGNDDSGATPSAGGGGGAAGAGAGANSVSDGRGGAGGSGTGVYSTWASATSTGSSGYYAGGGGGGGDNADTARSPGGGGQGGYRSGNPTTSSMAGLTNTGSGGGGSGGYSGGAGGSGGSGLVILRYAGTQRGTGGTVVTTGGFTYHTFTGTGSFTA